MVRMQCHPGSHCITTPQLDTTHNHFTTGRATTHCTNVTGKQIALSSIDRAISQVESVEGKGASMMDAIAVHASPWLSHTITGSIKSW